MKVGIQILSREYNFDSETPFTFEDVLELYPVVKHTNPRSLDARDLQEAGKAMLIQGRLDVAHDLLTEALAIVQQVHGPLHQDAATCERCVLVLLNDVNPPKGYGIWSSFFFRSLLNLLLTLAAGVNPPEATHGEKIAQKLARPPCWRVVTSGFTPAANVSKRFIRQKIGLENSKTGHAKCRPDALYKGLICMYVY